MGNQFYLYIFYILVFFIAIILIGFFLFISPLDHYKSTICERCNCVFAYKEDSKPDVREIKTKNGTITKYITRTYSWHNCGNKKTVHENKVIEPINWADRV